MLICLAELVHVYDGNGSLRRRQFRTVSVPKHAPAQALLVSYLFYYNTIGLLSFNIPVYYVIIVLLINETQATQHGFRTGWSCLANLLVFLDKLTQAVDKGNDLDVVYLDFAKAFDKTPYQLFINKLQQQGLNSKVLVWIMSWRSHRKQRMNVRGDKSEWKAVTSGIPQGSVLGLVVFLMYVHQRH